MWRLYSPALPPVGSSVCPFIRLSVRPFSFVYPSIWNRIRATYEHARHARTHTACQLSRYSRRCHRRRVLPSRLFPSRWISPIRHGVCPPRGSRSTFLFVFERERESTERSVQLGRLHWLQNFRIRFVGFLSLSVILRRDLNINIPSEMRYRLCLSYTIRTKDDFNHRAPKMADLTAVRS